MMGAVVVGGWAHSSAREHWALAAIVVATVALSLYLDADYYRILRNFGTQGRHLAPLLVGIPILAGRRWRPSSTAERVLVIGWCAVVLTCAGAGSAATASASATRTCSTCSAPRSGRHRSASSPHCC